MKNGLADQAARDRIATDLDTTLVVEAAAGTGKTSELVRRIVALLASGRARLEQIVAVTFTDAAAGELKLRVRAAIEEARHAPETDPAARAHLTAALPALEEARIGTIHGLCADLLREWPVEAGVDPAFEVAADDAASELKDAAFDRWFERQLANPGPTMRRVLARAALVRSDGPRTRLRRAVDELVERRDFPTPWRRAPFDRDGEMAALVAEMAALGALAASGVPDDFFTRSLERLARFADEVTRREAVRGADPDGLEAALIDSRGPFERHWNWSGRQRARHGFDRGEVLTRRTALATRLDSFIARTGADLAPALRDALWEVVEDYGLRKRRAGVLDFLDLLLEARALVRDHADVRSALKGRFTHLLVDEFQDTDPLQAELLLLLAADDPAADDWRRVRVVPGKLFVVGDPKQSIYRFRRADVALYEAVKQQLAAAGGATVSLTVSFRALPSIQTVLNAAFEPIMDGRSASQARYVPLSPHRPAERSRPSVVVVPVPDPHDQWGNVTNRAIEASTPDALAAFVDWLVRESGWMVTERGRSKPVPIAPRHICLLFRRFTTFGRDVTRPYVRALEARRLPHVLLGGGAFYAREEIAVVCSALGAIERPDDDLQVFATLRGPLFAFDDGVLLAFRETVGSLHPLRTAPRELPPPLAEVRSALDLLAELHRTRNHRPFGHTIARLLAAVRAHAAFAVWPTGEQTLASVARLLDLARRAEQRGTGSFRSFVEHLEDADTREAPILEEGAEGVRLMTVHRAKGLEFPVVVLADPTCRATPTRASRWTEAARGLCAMRLVDTAPAELLDHEDEEIAHEQEEAVRVLYVATTRARDLLVVPAVADGPQEGWVEALSPVLYANTPGSHPPVPGADEVVWWDVQRLRLHVEESGGVRQQRLLAADEGGVRAEAGVAAHARWEAARERVREAAAVRAVPTIAAGALAAGETDGPWAARAVRIEEVELDADRPHGVTFGTLVHGVLAAVDLDADRAAIEQLTLVEARVQGAPEDHIAPCAVAVERALAHPLVRAAARAARDGDCRRETTLSLRLADGTVVEGAVDLAFRAARGKRVWTVIDWKTDVELGERLPIYRRQVALYAEGIARATGDDVRAVLLRV